MHADANAAKASFDDIYVRPDPRDYFAVLGSLDYSIPDLGQPIFRQIASAWRATTGRSATILDLGSSYGINSALFRYPLTFGMLTRRYALREMMTVSSAELTEFDRHYYSSWPRAEPNRLVVADVAAPAIDYALRVGVADDGVAWDLEEGAPPEIARKLRDIDMVVSTGCVGYVTEKTFETILEATPNPPWIVSFCLRMFEYDRVAETLSRAGLVTEKLQSAAFIQRRFQDKDEASKVLRILNSRGLDPTGLEADGFLFAELFVSRPRESVQQMPLEEIVTIATGRHRSFGPRLIELRRGPHSRIARVR